MLSAHFIIVNYNSGEWLSRAVKSIFDHCVGVELKVSVVDNASCDGSMQLAQSNCTSNTVNWLFNQENLGFAAANNQILENCDTDFAILMNPDCELVDGSISAIFKAFEENQTYGLVSCRILNEDGTLQPTCRRRFPTPWSALVRMCLLNRLFPNNSMFSDFDYGLAVSASQGNHQVEAISGAFMVVRKRALTEVGLLDEGYFMHGEDLDWCKRFELSRWRVGFVPAAAVVHAKGISSKSRPVRVLWTLHKGMNRFFDKFYHESYAWPIRYSVKLGIFLSFITRGCIELIKSVFQRG